MVLQENKASQFFRKRNISYSLIRTRTCAFQGVRNIEFYGEFGVLYFLVTPVLRFALLSYYRQIISSGVVRVETSFEAYFGFLKMLNRFRERRCKFLNETKIFLYWFLLQQNFRIKGHISMNVSMVSFYTPRKTSETA